MLFYFLIAQHYMNIIKKPSVQTHPFLFWYHDTFGTNSVFTSPVFLCELLCFSAQLLDNTQKNVFTTKKKHCYSCFFHFAVPNQKQKNVSTMYAIIHL